jgi:hypothetical protein
VLTVFVFERKKQIGSLVGDKGHERYARSLLLKDRILWKYLTAKRAFLSRLLVQLPYEEG